MGDKFIVAVDQGTSGTSASLYDRRGLPLFRVDVPVTSQFPRPGWVEQDPYELVESIRASIRQLLSTSGVSPAQVDSIGIANQAEPLLLWDIETGKPVYPAIGWQCVRSADYCRQLIDAGQQPEFRRRTGLPLHPEWPATKVRWVLDNCPAAEPLLRQKRLVFGSHDTWFIYCLTGERQLVTDASTAARSGLYNLETRQWDPYLLELFGCQGLLLPDIRDSASYFGEIDLGPHGKAPWMGSALDQAAALLGQCCLSPGETKVTFGTCSALWLNLGRQIAITENLATSVGWQIGHGTFYAVDGESGSAGAAITWLARQMGLPWQVGELSKIAENASSDGNVIFVPALNGLGAPHWSPKARGAIFGLSVATGMEHLLRATLDAVAFSIRDVVESLKHLQGVELPSRVVADGGMSANEYLMQFQADILGLPVAVPENGEGTSAGVAFLAGLGSGYYPSLDDLRKAWRLSHLYEPGPRAASRQAAYARWNDAVRATIDMAAQ